uniref:Uncharacterized protein n=1 Tax=Rhizophora mucronata TaxID=61149 RepID=A0A2P2Q8I1_RHIMU
MFCILFCVNAIGYVLAQPSHTITRAFCPTDLCETMKCHFDVFSQDIFK